MGPTGRNLGRLPAISRKALAIALVAGGAASALAPVDRAFAQEAAGETRQTFAIPAGDLAAALRAFADQTGMQMVFSTTTIEGKRSAGAGGELTRTEALARILAGSGLSYQISDNRTVTIEAAAGADGARVLGAVRVQGAQDGYYGRAGQAAGVNGINGSRDITATEGTGSFTSGALTVGSKAPQAIKDVPQSVSVITNERLVQQNINDFTQALQQAPGVSFAQNGSSLDATFYSRGFEITSFQVDGGAPLTTQFGGSSGNAYFRQIDLSQYDHVEVLRGAAGLFNGYGDPSGTINLVRKKPLDHAQVMLDAEWASWNHYRTVLDATAPLALGGKLRGRLVLTWQSNEHFYEIAEDEKSLIYGVLDYDLSPTTLVTAGISQTSQDSVPWFLGLPRYQTGADLGLPRSTSFVFHWNRWDFDTTEIFGSIEQRIGNDWTAKINLTHNEQSSTSKSGYSLGAVSPTDNSGPRLHGDYRNHASVQFSAEATLSGAFTLFGQRQEVTVGVSRSNQDGGGQTLYDDPFLSSPASPYQPYPGGPRFCYSFGGNCPADTIPPATPPINVFDFNPFDPLYTEPANPLPTVRNLEQGQVQSLAYVNLRLTAFDRLHLQTGLRWSRYEQKVTSEQLCTQATSDDCIGRQIGEAYLTSHNVYSGEDISWPPAVALSYDLTDDLVGHLGYTDIYVDQSTLLDGDLKPLDPLTGENIEVGLKWAARDGRLNVALSVYRIKKQGFAQQESNFFDRLKLNSDGSVFIDGNGQIIIIANDGTELPDGRLDAYHSCCFVQRDDRTLTSEGIDAELTGELLPGWQVAASYTYSRTKQEGAYYGSDDGLPFLSIQPEHLYKIWTSYDFGAAGASGWLSGLTVSGGVNGQSKGYRSGEVCAVPLVELYPDLYPGFIVCPEGQTVSYSFTVAPYAVFSGRLDYRLNRRWSAALNVENISDKVYYQSVGDVSNGNWYGSPRRFTLSLRGKW